MINCSLAYHHKYTTLSIRVKLLLDWNVKKAKSHFRNCFTCKKSYQEAAGKAKESQQNNWDMFQTFCAGKEVLICQYLSRTLFYESYYSLPFWHSFTCTFSDLYKKGTCEVSSTCNNPTRPTTTLKDNIKSVHTQNIEL